MVDSYEFWLNKQIAKMRHTETNYDKHLDLMYDSNGNQTELRKHVNNVLYKVVVGELDKRYLGGVKSEIKLAQQAEEKKKRLEKIANKKSRKGKNFPSIEKQMEALARGLKRLENNEENRNKQVWLSAIGMWKPQIQMKYRNALPYKKDEE
ncbi:MAG: hypothetical protein J6W29_03070 [Neisseriaceae bacterium]|nr:hypothetical protein [Neisseriaceae bacterium]